MVPIEPDEFRAALLGELPSVYRLAYHLTLSANEADDLVQEVFLRALKSRDAFRWTEYGPRPWLFKILHNTYKTRAVQAGRDASWREPLDGVGASAPQPLPEGIDWEQLDQRLKKAIEDLPDSQRSVVLLWALEGMSYKEIADVTESPIGTVMSRLYRARETLAKQVADLGAELRMHNGSPRGKP